MKKKRVKEDGKEKIVYYDDNSTVHDMSGVTGRKDPAPKQKSTAREKWKTYFHAVKMMLFPMFLVLAVLALLFLILLLAFN